VRHIIEGERVFLRPFEKADAALYHRWRADADVAELAGLPLPLSRGQVEQRLAEK
jgi:RimJ/RimL family protein N-acetyltransferase